MKRFLSILLTLIFILSFASCKKEEKDDSNLSQELASTAQVYTYTPTMPATPLSDSEMFAYINQLSDMLKSLSSSGCSAATMKNVRDYGLLMQGYRYSDSSLASLMGYSGDIVLNVLNFRYRKYDSSAVYNAFAYYLSEFSKLNEQYSAYKPLSRLTLNQAMLSAYLIGNKDYNTNALTFAGSVSFSPTKSGITFDRVWESVGHYVGYPFENLQPVFFSDYKTLVATNTIMTDTKLKKEAKNAYYATSEYIDIFKNQTINYLFTDTTHILDYGAQGKLLTEQHIINNEIQIVNAVTVCKSINYDATATIISGNFEGKDNDKKFLLEMANLANTYNSAGEFVIAYLHFGETSSDEYKKNIARKLCDSGVGVVIGIGEGEIEGIELYNGKYIFYNIGPLIDGSNTDLSVKSGLAVQVILKKSSDATVLDNIIVIPFSVNSNIGEKWNNFQPTPMFEASLDNEIKKIIKKSSGYEYGVEMLNYFKTTA